MLRSSIPSNNKISNALIIWSRRMNPFTSWSKTKRALRARKRSCMKIQFWLLINWQHLWISSNRLSLSTMAKGGSKNCSTLGAQCSKIKQGVKANHKTPPFQAINSSSASQTQHNNVTSSSRRNSNVNSTVNSIRDEQRGKFPPISPCPKWCL